MADKRTIICCGTQPDGEHVVCSWALVDSTAACPIGCPECGSSDLLTIAGPGITEPANGPVPFQEPARIAGRVKHPLVVKLRQAAATAAGAA